MNDHECNDGYWYFMYVDMTSGISGYGPRLEFFISWLRGYFRYGSLSHCTFQNCHISGSEQTLTADKVEVTHRTRYRVLTPTRNLKSDRIKENNVFARQPSAEQTGKSKRGQKRSMRCNWFRNKTLFERHFWLLKLQNMTNIIVGTTSVWVHLLFIFLYVSMCDRLM